jgi:spore coat protein U-like protein
MYGRAAASSCSFDAASSLPFGNYDVFSQANVDVMGLMTVTCNTSNVQFTLSLSRGESASFSQRYMSNGADRLIYSVYVDSGRTQVWGDGTLGSTLLSQTTGQKDHAYPIYDYARIPYGQDVSVGAYSDTVVATMEM